MNSPIILILLSIFSLVPITDNDNNYNTSNEIVWSANAPLSWNDFSGQPNFSESNDALTNSAIYFGYNFDGNQTYEIEVYSSFFRDKSWVKENNSNSQLLSHEQRHFDITEIYARKLRKELTRYAQNGKSLDKNYEKVFSKYFQMLEKEQAAYDRDTHHSRNKSVQKKWDQLIQKKLSELDDYSSIKMTVVCNGLQ